MINTVAIKMNIEELVKDKSKFPNGWIGTIRRIENCSKVENVILIIRAKLS